MPPGEVEQEAAAQAAAELDAKFERWESGACLCSGRLSAICEQSSALAARRCMHCL